MTLTLNKRADGSERLVCHYCGRVYEYDGRCRKCGGQMKMIGAGTQKIEEEARKKASDYLEKIGLENEVGGLTLRKDAWDNKVIWDIGFKNGTMTMNSKGEFEYLNIPSYTYTIPKNYGITREQARIVAKELFEAFSENPKLLPPDVYFRYLHCNDSESEEYDGYKNNELRVICDYIAGMTDRFALEEHERITNPRIRI